MLFLLHLIHFVEPHFRPSHSSHNILVLTLLTFLVVCLGIVTQYQLKWVGRWIASNFSIHCTPFVKNSCLLLTIYYYFSFAAIATFFVLLRSWLDRRAIRFRKTLKIQECNVMGIVEMGLSFCPSFLLLMWWTCKTASTMMNLNDYNLQWTMPWLLVHSWIYSTNNHCSALHQTKNKNQGIGHVLHQTWDQFAHFADVELDNVDAFL